MLLHRVILLIATLFILILSEIGISQSEEHQNIRPVLRERGINAMPRKHYPYPDGNVCGIHKHGTDHCPKERTCGYIDEELGWECSPSEYGTFCISTKNFCPKGFICSKLNLSLCVPNGTIECDDTIECGSRNFICQNGICIEQHISTLDKINLLKATNSQANKSLNVLQPNQASNIASSKTLNGEEGVDLFELTSIDKFKCLKEKLSVKFVIVRASRSNGHFDNNSVANIKNAWAAGINEVDIYIWPCVKPKSVEHVICDNAR
ncbi:unnamed protein product [Meloidogyne enterolobii]|uniref:Uncharacterized protein n=1 Tax=Meloidogyne enterolobii TaxID=390850 RepID=A0ACB0ZEG8_MELEN